MFLFILMNRKTISMTEINNQVYLGSPCLVPLSGQKKSSLVPENQPGENFLSLTHPHSRMSIRLFVFSFKKQQTNKQKNQNKTKIKKNKRNQRRNIS